MFLNYKKFYIEKEYDIEFSVIMIGNDKIVAEKLKDFRN